MGFGLITVSIVAFRNINQTPSDAADRAFFDTVEEIASRLMRIVLLPIDFLVACKDALVSLILFPFRLVSSSISKAGKLGQTLLGAARDWFLWLLCLPAQLLSSLLHRSEDALKKTYANLTDRFLGLLVRLDESILGIWFHKTEQVIAGFVHRVQFQWTLLNHEVSGRILSVQNFGGSVVQGAIARKERISEFVALIPVQRIKTRWVVLNRQVSDSIFWVQIVVERTVQSAHTTYNQVVDRCTKEHARVAKLSKTITSSRQYHSLNKTVAACAIVVEDWIRNILSGMNLKSK